MYFKNAIILGVSPFKIFSLIFMVSSKSSVKDLATFKKSPHSVLVHN